MIDSSVAAISNAGQRPPRKLLAFINPPELALQWERLPQQIRASKVKTMIQSRTFSLLVNSNPVPVKATPDQPLLMVLREQVGLTSCKISCGEGACGACTVLLDDQPVRACVTAVALAAGRSVRTLEGLADGEQLHPLQQAFLDHVAFQCGYCTPGMIMAALGLLLRSPRPDDAAIADAMQGNLCRCGSYPRILAAIRQAAGEMGEGA
jgi:aerobic-type carbon monoxide dehydrogenase small subunit (CoxS/CutS family)